MRYGYASTTGSDKDSAALQRQVLVQAGVPEARISFDLGAGAVTPSRRPAWRALEARLRTGDELTVCRLDRLGRSVSEIVTIVGELVERGVQVRSLADDVDPTTGEGRAKLALLSTLADLHREGFRRQVQRGIHTARSRGVSIGRPRVDPDDVQRKVLTIQHLVETEGLTIAEAVRMIGWSRSSFYRHRTK